MKNFVIAAGGRGSQALEALIHLYAAGFSKSATRVLIIDEDDSNANTQRTIELLNTYQKIKKHLPIDSPIFSSEITPFVLDDNGAIEEKKYQHWHFLSGNQRSLLDVIGDGNRDSDTFMLRRLFLTEDELSEDLSKGFKGHPTIGAIVYGQVEIDHENPRNNLDEFVKEIISELAQEDCKLFITGSLFGGNGAAVIPSIPRKIKKYIAEKAREVRRTLYIGGGFLAPYFTFTAPQLTNEEKLFAHSEFFIPNTQAVLSSFDDLIGDSLYNSVYLIGDQNLIRYTKSATGGTEQANPPHFVEMLTAYSVIDFFNNLPADRLIKYIFAKSENEQGNKTILRWEIFDQIFETIGKLQDKLVTFSILYSAFEKHFKKRWEDVLSDKYAGIWGDREPWFKEIFKSKDVENLANTENRTLLKLLADYFNSNKIDSLLGFYHWQNYIIDQLKNDFRENDGSTTNLLIDKDFVSKGLASMKIDGKENKKVSHEKAINDYYLAFRDTVPIVDGEYAFGKMLTMLYKGASKIYSTYYLIDESTEEK